MLSINTIDLTWKLTENACNQLADQGVKSAFNTRNSRKFVIYLKSIIYFWRNSLIRLSFSNILTASDQWSKSNFVL